MRRGTQEPLSWSSSREQAYAAQVQSALQAQGNPVKAAAQQRYMKGHFSFYGLPASLRRATLQPFLSPQERPPLASLQPVVLQLWSAPQRECQYAAQELLARYAPEAGDLPLLEQLITLKSWWDTVDFISSKLVGRYLWRFTEERHEAQQRWLSSGNLWLQRCSLLYQLSYRRHTDLALLEQAITSLQGSREFFIRKAIGWALRQYSKTDPVWVRSLVEKTFLSHLSRSEALKYVEC